MRKFLATLAVCGWRSGAGSALAATTQQDKMKTCNSEASTKQLSGDARKQFMSSCLSGQQCQACGDEQGTDLHIRGHG